MNTVKKVILTIRHDTRDTNYAIAKNIGTSPIMIDNWFKSKD